MRPSRHFTANSIRFVGPGPRRIRPSTRSRSPQEDATDILDRAIEDAFDDDPPDLTRQVIAGPPSRTLIELSADSAMLVLGSRGHGGFAGLLLGSVSAACGEHAYCPVLIVHKRRSVVASEEMP